MTNKKGQAGWTTAEIILGVILLIVLITIIGYFVVKQQGLTTELFP